MNFLIIKTGALGDVLRSTFLAQALKEKYRFQEPKVYWITKKSARQLFLNNPYVYKVVSEENKNFLKKLEFELVINLEEDLENCQFTSSLKTKKLIGFYFKDNQILPTPTMKEWFDMSILGKKPFNDILKKENKKTHRQIISEAVGIKDYHKYEPFLRLVPWQRKFAKDFLRRQDLKKEDLIIGINTGSADRWPKHLSIKNTAKLIDLLYKKFNAKILLFGGPNESERNREILRVSKSPIIITGCGNNLVEFPALISVCDLVISSDTFGLHIALALKRKTIALIGPTSVSEIEMYSLGSKIVAKSKCICCYKKDCNSMEKIDLNEIVEESKKLLKQKITLVITAFKEPKISETIQAALNQKTKYDYEIIVSVPDKETIELVKKYKQVKIFKDPGKGKSYALNLIFEQIKDGILILTDGDVTIGENTIEEIANAFLDPELGCLSGRPFPKESKKTKYGYWAHFLFESAHRIRKNSFLKNDFIECSGYLFAFRKESLKKIPLDVAEDTVIPYIFWGKGYKIGYVENALVYVKNADNLKDWFKQKIRTHKSHGNLSRYVDVVTTPKVKSFKTEAKGLFWLLKYPENLKEFFWSTQLGLMRFLTWIKYFLDTHILDRHYQDAWERIESTK